MKTEGRYTSFGVGGLLFDAFDRLSSMLRQTDWEAKLKLEAIENQYLRMKTESARKRIVSEMIKRCRSAWPGFWDYYTDLNESERRAALFALCIKTYPLVSDIHLQFGTRAYWLQDEILSCAPIMNEIEKMADTNPVLGKWAGTTRYKNAQTYLRTLHDAGLMERHKLIKLALPEDWFCFYLKAGDQWVMDAFFATEPEKQQLKNYCQ